MSPNLDRIRARLRNAICPTCVRYTASHTCSLVPPRTCSVFKNLDTIVGIVARTHSRSVEPYAEAVRDRVCSACPCEDNHGCCPMRDGIDCALDTYLPIVVDEIEAELAAIRRDSAN